MRLEIPGEREVNGVATVSPPASADSLTPHRALKVALLVEFLKSPDGGLALGLRSLRIAE